jgi:serine/threonine-protein kinase
MTSQLHDPAVRVDGQEALNTRRGAANTPVHTNQSVRAEIDSERQRRSIRRAMLIAVWVWPSFTMLDVLMQATLYPAARTWHYLSLRVLEEVILVLFYRVSLSRNITLGTLIKAHNLSFVTIGLCIVLIALDFGGLNSAYVHGLSIAMLVRCVVVAAPISLQLRALAPMALSFPVVLAIVGAFSPSVRAAWLDRDSVLRFASNYVFVITSGLVGAISSRTVWHTQQQLYQARKLGRYRLEAPIGEGGMNEVWLAWDDRLRRNVALKLLRTEGTPEDAAVLRFEQEAYAASKLNNPNTIRIFDFGASDDGIYYIAMEYLRGADLAALVRDHGPLPVPRVVYFGIQACRSLIEAHDAGIIHRDIKPHNLFITRVGDDPDFLKLFDFGIARMVSSANVTALTTTGSVHGTPAFMSPEACCGMTADARSDIYSLGATLYYLLTGVPPFDGTTMGQMLVAHLTHEPLAPSRVRNEPISRAVEAIVLRCLAKDPQGRYQSARDLCTALEALSERDAWTKQRAEHFWHERDAKRERPDT